MIGSRFQKLLFYTILPSILYRSSVIDVPFSIKMYFSRHRNLNRDNPLPQSVRFHHPHVFSLLSITTKAPILTKGAYSSYSYIFRTELFHKLGRLTLTPFRLLHFVPFLSRYLVSLFLSSFISELHGYETHHLCLLSLSSLTFVIDRTTKGRPQPFFN